MCFLSDMSYFYHKQKNIKIQEQIVIFVYIL